jgi:hypothetical protein
MLERIMRQRIMLVSSGLGSIALVTSIAVFLASPYRSGEAIEDLLNTSSKSSLDDFFSLLREMPPAKLHSLMAVSQPCELIPCGRFTDAEAKALIDAAIKSQAVDEARSVTARNDAIAYRSSMIASGGLLVSTLSFLVTLLTFLRGRKNTDAKGTGVS